LTTSRLTAFFNKFLRLGELCQLDINSITTRRHQSPDGSVQYFGGGEVIGKGRKRRQFLVGPAALQALAEYIKGRRTKDNNPALFLSERCQRIATAAASALRRSEVRGLKWADLDLHACWFNLQRGYVSKDQTKMKTRASRKGVEMLPALAAALLVWRDHTPYNQDSDWVFASPFTNGKRPYWPESALHDHIKPAAAKAGITKRVTWHTFRHSLASFLGQQGEGVKTVQELLRHATSRITIDTYQQGSTEAKRSALNRVAGILSAPGKSS
jgi:integrase